MIGYYDAILGLVATLLVGGAIASFALGVGAIVIAASIAAVAIGHAMFVNPPENLPQEVKHANATYEVAD